MSTQPERVSDYLAHMDEAIGLACSFVEGLTKDDFLSDRKTQQAVILNLIVLGEATSKIAAEPPEFLAVHPELPWQQMRGMRNRMAHGYFEINLDVVWETVKVSLPGLQRPLAPLPANT